MMCHTAYFLSNVKKLKTMTRVLVVALLTGCSSAAVSVTPATPELTTIVPTPTNSSTFLLADQPGEVIIVNGDCLETEVEVKVEGNSFCMDRSFMDFFCFFVGCNVPPPPPGVENPHPPGGGGGGPITPSPPTLMQCEEAFFKCQNEVLTNGLYRCMFDKAVQAGTLVSRGFTCQGDPSHIWEGIDRVGVHECKEEDFHGSAGYPYDQCQAQFIETAMKECFKGRPDISTQSGATISIGIPLSGFGQFGIETLDTVTVQQRGGAGLREICTAAAIKASDEGCTAARMQCEAKAIGATNRVEPVSTPSVEELMTMIDRERLGLDAGIGQPAQIATEGSFRDIQQGASEMDEVYRMRVQFLADWSKFLKESEVTPNQQLEIQKAFQRAQYGFTNTRDELDTLVIFAWLPDLKTESIGTVEDQQLLQKFVETGEFSRRATDAEVTLFEDVGTVLGQAGLDQFKAQVWRGIYRFGYAGPMYPRQVVSPPNP